MVSGKMPPEKTEKIAPLENCALKRYRQENCPLEIATQNISLIVIFVFDIILTFIFEHFRVTSFRSISSTSETSVKDLPVT